MSKSFPHIKQPDSIDCGATCLAMVSKHYGKNYTIQRLREMCYATREGVSMYGISDAAEKIGFKTMGVRWSFEKLAEEAPLPCIVHWNQEHFVVVYDICAKRDSRDTLQSLRATNEDENPSRVTRHVSRKQR